MLARNEYETNPDVGSTSVAFQNFRKNTARWRTIWGRNGSLGKWVYLPPAVGLAAVYYTM